MGWLAEGVKKKTLTIQEVYDIWRHAIHMKNVSISLK
ncbi:Uncharacterised protein [Paenibacillus polymyxa]|nr:Uncharacterised protein [Paenibacillus polymyxa]